MTRGIESEYVYVAAAGDFSQHGMSCWKAAFFGVCRIVYVRFHGRSVKRVTLTKHHVIDVSSPSWMHNRTLLPIRIIDAYCC